MKIFSIGWVQDDSYGLSGVVIANNEQEAIDELGLDASYETLTGITEIGICHHECEPFVVCKESL